MLVPFVIECYIHTDNLSMNVHVLYVATKVFFFSKVCFQHHSHELQYNLGGRGWTKKRGKKERRNDIGGNGAVWRKGLVTPVPKDRNTGTNTASMQRARDTRV